MLRCAQHTRHLLKIYRTLARYDALFFLEQVRGGGAIIALGRLFAVKKQPGRPGERLSRALESLGPTFIKLGQALSIRADLIGDEIAKDLTQLQDRVPPFAAKTAKAIIERELGQPLARIYREFDDVPIAAASISQVHFATDHHGNKLAVKVLRPKVEQRFAKDISTIRWVAESLDRVKKFKRLRLPEVVDEFEKTVKLEMDLRFEAAAASEFKENMAQDATIHIPQIDWHRTAQRVLTMERVGGIRIDDVPALKNAGHDVSRLMHHASELFFQQVYRDGFFHADMHPGNVFVGADGRIIVMDFGIMGRLDTRTRIFLAQMLIAFLNRDYQKVSEVHFKAGYIPPNQDPEIFAQACRSIGEPVFGRPQNEISIASLLAQLFKITEDFQMETQPQLLLLQKTMMLAEGTARKLNPNVNFWELCRPLMESWARETFGPKGQAKLATERLKEAGSTLERAFHTLEHLPHLITKDGIRLHPETISQHNHAGRTKSLIWFLLGGISSGLIVYFMR